jgi:hypothetical protein
MFYFYILKILNDILLHTLDNDIKFQVRKLIKKISLKKFQNLEEDIQRKEIFNLIEEVRYGFDTMKENKIRATDIIEKIIKKKMDLYDI